MSTVVFLPGASGRRDYWSPVAALLPCAHFETIADAGHMLADERPDEVATRISAFLAE